MVDGKIEMQLHVASLRQMQFMLISNLSLVNSLISFLYFLFTCAFFFLSHS